MKLRAFAALSIVAELLSCTAPAPAGPRHNQITILYDAFGKPSNLKKDWGYSALIEQDGKRILFDTGNNPDLFKHNIEALAIDLRNLDFVVISHRHGDHTSGLNHVLSLNPNVPIYVPYEISGFGLQSSLGSSRP